MQCPVLSPSALSYFHIVICLFSHTDFVSCCPVYKGSPALQVGLRVSIGAPSGIPTLLCYLRLERLFKVDMCA